jgi:hypothetical protein
MHSPAPDADVEAADQPVLVLREAAVPDVGPEVVEPPEPAALAAPVQPYKRAKGLTIRIPSTDRVSSAAKVRQTNKRSVKGVASYRSCGGAVSSCRRRRARRCRP